MKPINLRRSVKRGKPTLLDKYVASILKESQSIKWVDDRAILLCAYVEYATPILKFARIKEALIEAIDFGKRLYSSAPDGGKDRK